MSGLSAGLRWVELRELEQLKARLTAQRQRSDKHY